MNIPREPVSAAGLRGRGEIDKLRLINLKVIEREGKISIHFLKIALVWLPILSLRCRAKRFSRYIFRFLLHPDSFQMSNLINDIHRRGGKEWRKKVNEVEHNERQLTHKYLIANGNLCILLIHLQLFRYFSLNTSVDRQWMGRLIDLGMIRWTGFLNGCKIWLFYSREVSDHHFSSESCHIQSLMQILVHWMNVIHSILASLSVFV